MTTIATDKMMIGRSATPRAVFHLPCNETGTPAAVTDSIRGCVITPDNNGAVDGNGLLLDETTGTNVTSAPLPTILDTESALLIVCGKQGAPNSDGTGYGAANATTAGILLNNNNTVRLTSAAEDSAIVTGDVSLSEGDIFMTAGLIDRASGNFNIYQQTDVGSTALGGSSAPIGNWDGNEIDPSIYLSIPLGIITTRNTYYSIILYKWTGGVPVNILTALDYYAVNPKAGIKTLYPGWN